MKKRKPPIENKIYAAIIAECERMEAAKIYKGNGHHLAQRLVPMISAGLLSKQQSKLYNLLTTSPQSTKEIAIKAKMNTKSVSAQLKQIQDANLLVLSKYGMNKKRKLWYKA